MNTTEIRYDIRDQVATITLNRPERLNAWTRVMSDEVRAAVLAAAADAQVRALVITGAGRGFCAGADMNLLGGLAAQPPAQPAVAAADAGRDAQDPGTFGYLLRVGKPIVAAINGPVAGIGLCLALFCDLRLMADGAKLTTAFARRGLIAEHGSSWMLPRLVGPMAALDLLMSARTVSAGEAAQMGLVRLLPEPDFAASAHAVALELAQWSSPRSMAVIKRQVYDALTQSCTQAIEVADREMVASFASEDFREGVAHFVERRAPAFTGR